MKPLLIVCAAAFLILPAGASAIQLPDAASAPPVAKVTVTAGFVTGVALVRGANIADIATTDGIAVEYRVVDNSQCGLPNTRSLEFLGSHHAGVMPNGYGTYVALGFTFTGYGGLSLVGGSTVSFSLSGNNPALRMSHDFIGAGPGSRVEFTTPCPDDDTGLRVHA